VLPLVHLSNAQKTLLGDNSNDQLGGIFQIIWLYVDPANIKSQINYQISFTSYQHLAQHFGDANFDSRVISSTI
jgi:hypothetical protein